MGNRRKHWSKLVEERGIRIRIYERPGSSRLWYGITRGGEEIRASLKTSDRAEAERRARAIAKEIGRAEITGESLGSLTLGQLFDDFFQKKAPSYTERWRKQAHTRRKLFEAAWGSGKRVEDIAQSDVDHFADLRRKGKIASGTSTVKEVREGTIEADLRWLSTVFNWAKGVKIGGKRLVPSNPLDGLERPRELNPRQPKASHERFVKTLAKTDEVDPKGRLSCMLVLARYMGRRENAICQLRASDILWDKKAVLERIASLGLDENAAEFYPEGGIHWRADTDKQGVNSISPISGTTRQELERYLGKSPRIGDVPLFPTPKDPEAPMRKDVAGRWLRKAEKLAGLPPLAGGIWHPYRRLFAIELKTLPIHDVAAAGGWSSTETVQRIYQKAEPKGVLAAIQRIGNGA